MSDEQREKGLEWFDKVGYNADIPALDREFGLMTRFWDWVRAESTGWVPPED